MELFLFLLFIWIFIIQMKLNELSNEIKHKKTEFKNSTNIKEQNIQDFDIILQQNEQNEQNEQNKSIIEKESDEDLFAQFKEIEYTKNKPFDFESAFLGNIFNKIGAIALIIGIIIFIKLVSAYITFTPAIRIFLGYVSGIIMLICGCRMSDEKLKGYKETLLGTGISVAFITTYCASVLFQLFSPLTSVIIATTILICVYVIADKQKTMSMIIIALIAGYLNPILDSTNISCEFLFGYYIFVNLLSLIYVYKNPNRDVINFINLSLTFAVLSVFQTINSSSVSVIYPILLWLSYLIYDVLRKEKSDLQTDKNNILNWMNFGILTVFTVISFSANKLNIGFLLLAVGFLYSGLVIKYIKKNSENYKPYLYSTLVILLICTYMLFDENWQIGLWAAESAIISIIANKYKLKYLANWSVGFLLASVTGLLTTENIIYFNNINEYSPIFNTRTLHFLFPILSSVLTYNILINSDDNDMKNLGQIFKFSFISLIYLYITFELNSLINKLNSGKIDKNFISAMLFSIIGFKYAMQTRRLYDLSKFTIFNYISYTISSVALITILIAGFTYKPVLYYYPIINFRFLAYLTAIFAAIFYAKQTKSEIFKYIAVVLGFILVHIETNDLMHTKLFVNNNVEYMLTVMWLIYAGIVTLVGIFKNKQFCKNTGIWISILAIFRIFIFDLDGTDMIYKLVAFITLGLILLLVSYFYNKYNKANNKE